MIEEESLSAKRKGREELKIRRETDRLREEIKWSRGMTDEQKADTLVALNEQSNLMIDRLYGRETPSTPIILQK